MVGADYGIQCGKSSESTAWRNKVWGACIPEGQGICHGCGVQFQVETAGIFQGVEREIYTGSGLLADNGILVKGTQGHFGPGGIFINVPIQRVFFKVNTKVCEQGLVTGLGLILTSRKYCQE